VRKFEKVCGKSLAAVEKVKIGKREENKKEG
jgi:hypothetical protein